MVLMSEYDLNEVVRKPKKKARSKDLVQISMFIERDMHEWLKKNKVNQSKLFRVACGKFGYQEPEVNVTNETNKTEPPKQDSVPQEEEMAEQTAPTSMPNFKVDASSRQ